MGEGDIRGWTNDGQKVHGSAIWRENVCRGTYDPRPRRKTDNNPALVDGRKTDGNWGLDGSPFFR